MGIGEILLIILGVLVVLVLFGILLIVLSIFGIVRGTKELIDTTNDGVNLSKKGYGFAKRKFKEKKDGEK